MGKGESTVFLRIEEWRWESQDRSGRDRKWRETESTRHYRREKRSGRGMKDGNGEGNRDLVWRRKSRMVWMKGVPKYLEEG